MNRTSNSPYTYHHDILLGLIQENMSRKYVTIEISSKTSEIHLSSEMVFDGPSLTMIAMMALA